MAANGPFTVFGGTGFLGRRVVSSLLGRGHRVRVAARHPDRRPDLLESGRADPVEVDIFDRNAVAGALDGAAGAVNATSLYVETNNVSFEDMHVNAAARLAEDARRAGVPCLVQLSGIGADPDADDAFIRARGRGETAVRAAFESAVLVRPSVMFGKGDAFLSAIRRLVRMPLSPLFGSGATLLQPALVNDVADGITTLLTQTDPRPLHEFAGADVLSYRALVATVAEAEGRVLRPVPVPFAVWRALAAMAERLPGAPLTRSQVALIERDNIASSDLPGLGDLDIAPVGIKAWVKGEQHKGADRP